MSTAALAGQFGEAFEYIFAGTESVTGGLRVGGPELIGLTGQHMLISLLALTAAAALCVPLGLYLGHYGRGGVLAINISNVGRAVPPLALIALFIAFLGIGLLNVTVVLALLALPPILTNTYVGVRQVSAEAVDAARAMGMTAGGIVRRIELPLALPLIFGGIRTSTVNVIATATIAPLVGVLTLGDPITAQSVYGREGLIGAAIIVAVLAVGAEVALGAAQRAVTPAGLKAPEPRSSR